LISASSEEAKRLASEPKKKQAEDMLQQKEGPKGGDEERLGTDAEAADNEQ